METKTQIPKPADAFDQKWPILTKFLLYLLSFEKEIASWSLY